MHSVHWLASLVVALSVTLFTPCLVAMPTTGALCTDAQVTLEKRALAVFNSHIVQAQIAESRAVYENDPMAHTLAGQQTLDAALQSMAMGMVISAVNGDPQRPQVMWGATAAHEWFGHTMLNSGYGIENPDNIYRRIPMDAKSSYEIRGRMPPDPPAQQNFTLYSVLPGTGKMVREGSPVIGALSQLVTDPDGHFVITVDPNPAGDRHNHIQSREPTATLIIRDSLNDWSTQSPVPLSVERVAGPEPDAPSGLTEQAMHAAALIGQVVPFWANYFRRFVFSQPPNQIPTPISRDGGWGLSTMAHFALRDEHALVITLNPLDADYFGMQVADPWGLASTYVDRTGSLSLSQVQRNEDGNVTYVIAASNPGVHNWLDTGGLDRGTLVARWQGVTSSPDRAPAVLSARQLPIKALDGLTVKPPQQFSRAAHARRLHERAKQYRRRLCGSAANDADTPA